jgi:hypothetical protein
LASDQAAYLSFVNLTERAAARCSSDFCLPALRIGTDQAIVPTDAGTQQQPVVLGNVLEHLAKLDLETRGRQAGGFGEQFIE